MNQISALLTYALFGTAIGAFGPVFLKKASKKLSFSLSFLKNKYFIYGVLAYLVSTIIFLAMLRYVELSLLYPSVSLIYVWVSFLSIKMLKERMNMYKWFGIILIIIGVVFIGIGA